MFPRFFLGLKAILAAAVLLAGAGVGAAQDPPRYRFSRDQVDGARRYPVRDATPNGTPLNPPIFMTSTNYPGVMGMYYLGAGFSMTPIGQPFAPTGLVYTQTFVRPETTEQPRDTSALIRVRVPEGADLWMNGDKVRQTGALRRFVTPPLDAGREYEYEFTARWQEGGRERVQHRTVTVSPGDRVTVSLLPRAESPSLKSTPRGPALRGYTVPPR